MYPMPLNVPVQRGVFCNRTLNLRNIKAIGYDMDYTLVHYNVEAWEGCAYEHIKQRLLLAGWPVESLHFELDFAVQGLIIDKELGNILEANRFGYVKRAVHGTTTLSRKELRKAYSRTLVSLAEPRYYFLNTLFSISEACIYAQLVDLLDAGQLPDKMNYHDLFEKVRKTLDSAHVEGQLKADITSDPERFVDLDPEMPLTLLDQRNAGKKLMLITNSEWSYTCFMMNYAVDQFLPEGMSWRDLFDVIVVSARKPDFFSGNAPAFEVINDKGLLQPVVGKLQEGKAYLGGHATMIENMLGLSGDEILYVGDHVFGDVNVSKNVLRWRTALILREIEEELTALHHFKEKQQQILDMMKQKIAMEDEFSRYRLELQRSHLGYGPQTETPARELEEAIRKVREKLVALDAKIAPLAIEQNQNHNRNWGYLFRSGNDKSHLTRQIERYADVYTSRVSNFMRYTPFMFFRSMRGSMPHDPYSY